MATATTVEGDVVDRVFAVGTGAVCNIGNIAGHVKVRAGEAGEIRVRAVKRGSDRARENTEIEFEMEGNRLSVRTRSASSGKRFGIQFGWNVAAVDYDVVMPADTRVEAKGVSASLDIAGLGAPVTAKTVSGEISLAEIRGDLHITSVSGSMTGHHLQGELALHGTSGSATLRDCRLPSFNLHSVSGSFTIDTPLEAGGRYQAQTVSGSLKLRVPAGTGATIQLKSVSGGVRVDGLTSQAIKLGPRRWHGRIGDGSATVEMNSVSGSIRLESTDPDTSLGEPASAAADRQSRTDILRALQQGEIDVDEAMARLETR